MSLSEDHPCTQRTAYLPRQRRDVDLERLRMSLLITLRRPIRQRIVNLNEDRSLPDAHLAGEQPVYSLLTYSARALLQTNETIQRFAMESARDREPDFAADPT
jgi:hypothetical protein